MQYFAHGLHANYTLALNRKYQEKDLGYISKVMRRESRDSYIIQNDYFY